MTRSRQLTEEQRADLLRDLDGSLSIVFVPLLRFRVLKRIADLMGQLGLNERGGWTRGVLNEAIRYAGRNFFQRSLKIEATNSTSWSGIGFDRLPHGPTLANVIFTLTSLDETRSLRATITCSLSGSNVTAQGFVGQVQELSYARFTVQNGDRATRTHSWKRESNWSKTVMAAFSKGGTAGVWSALDQAWGEVFGRPAAFMRRPLSPVAIQARCQLLEGNPVQVTTASGNVITGTCGGFRPEKPQEPHVVRIVHASPKGTTEVSLSEIFDLRPDRVVG